MNETYGSAATSLQPIIKIGEMVTELLKKSERTADTIEKTASNFAQESTLIIPKNFKEKRKKLIIKNKTGEPSSSTPSTETTMKNQTQSENPQKLQITHSPSQKNAKSKGASGGISYTKRETSARDSNQINREGTKEIPLSGKTLKKIKIKK